MLNKKYTPNFGLVILLITLIASVFLIDWAINSPYNYEKAIQEEQLGKKLAKEGNNKEAFEHFLKAAKTSDDNIDKSRCYRCTATTSSTKEDKIKYFKYALALNENNIEAKNGLKKLLEKKDFTQYIDMYKDSIVYTNRYTDGWSKSLSASVQIEVKNDFENIYELSYYTSNPKKQFYTIHMELNNHSIMKKIIENNKKYYHKVFLTKGEHTLQIKIDDTFNPKKQKMAQDSRKLGVQFTIKKIGVKIDE